LIPISRQTFYFIIIFFFFRKCQSRLPGPTHSPSQFIWASLSLGLKWPVMNLTTHLQLALRLRMSGPILLFPLYTFMAWKGTVVLGFTVKQFYRSSDCVRDRRVYRTQALPFFSEDRKLHRCRNVVFYCKTYLMKKSMISKLTIILSVSPSKCVFYLPNPFALYNISIFTKCFAIDFPRF